MITRRNLMTGAAATLAFTAAARRTALAIAPNSDQQSAPDGWSTGAPRPEISPAFSHDPHAGPQGRPAMMIRADAREGLDGYWVKSFPIEPGKTYRFSARYRAANVPVERRSVLAKLDWKDAKGRSVVLDQPTVSTVLTPIKAMAETESPSPGQTIDG